LERCCGDVKSAPAPPSQSFIHHRPTSPQRQRTPFKIKLSPFTEGREPSRIVVDQPQPEGSFNCPSISVAFGMRTAFVARPLEFGSSAKPEIVLCGYSSYPRNKRHSYERSIYFHLGG
jgi:hypothetical protein